MKNFSVTLLLVLLSMTANKALAYEIAVENGDNVTIYYNYINDGKELEVTTQNGSAGSGYESVTKLSIPATVTYMGQTRPVTSIGYWAFQNCTSLTSVDIPNTVTAIGWSAFQNCSGLTSIEIPNSMKSVGGDAFVGCSGLQKVIVRDLDAWCKIDFVSPSATPLRYAKHLYSDENTEITNLVIPNSVTSIARDAFLECESITSVEIGNSVTEIGQEAFKKCKNLSSVKMSNSVKSIAFFAFEGCSSLTSVEIPKSVTSIANFAFMTCPSIESIKVDEGNTNYDSRDNCNAIIETATNSLRAGCKNTVIPIGVESIGGTAFVGCSGLTSIEIPNTLTKIEGTPFAGCELQKVIVRDLSAWCRINFETGSCNPLCFSGHLYSDENTEIKALVIPDDVTYISQNAFRDASCLNSVTIPEGVTSIGSNAFNFSNDNEQVNIYSYILEPTSNTGSSFSNKIYNSATLHIPQGTIERYKATTGWKKFVNIVEDIPSEILTIPNSSAPKELFCYSVTGTKITSPQRGINIIRMSDGTTKKMVVK